MGFIRHHQKTLGILVLLVVLTLAVGAKVPTFLSEGSLVDVLHWTGLFGILSVAAALVIVTGGIDLSMGSLIGMSGVLLPMLLRKGALFYSGPVSIPVAFITVIGLGALVGLIHGGLVTRLSLPPFLVTLCGLFVYRSLALVFAKNDTQGFEDTFQSLRALTAGANPFYLLLGLAGLASLFLHKTIWGRHLLALGRNETAAHFSGIPTARLKIISFMLCGALAAFGGSLFVLENVSASPSSFGLSYELYAIAGAVLGGCSLRGGECAMAGVICGSALVQVSTQAALFLNVKSEWKLTVIGLLILVGVISDELFRRYSVRQRAKARAA
jgi:ribose transport system permease protein